MSWASGFSGVGEEEEGGEEEHDERGAFEGFEQPEEGVQVQAESSESFFRDAEQGVEGLAPGGERSTSNSKSKSRRT